MENSNVCAAVGLSNIENFSKLVSENVLDGLGFDVMGFYVLRLNACRKGLVQTFSDSRHSASTAKHASKGVPCLLKRIALLVF